MNPTEIIAVLTQYRIHHGCSRVWSGGRVNVVRYGGRHGLLAPPPMEDVDVVASPAKAAEVRSRTRVATIQRVMSSP
jgi:hypothetical protein